MGEYSFNQEVKMSVPDDVTHIIEKLEENGFEAFAVGGCVRDTILGRNPQDWDITTSALPLDIKKIFRRTIDTGIQHGTVTIMIGKIGYEVTTYRIDGEYTDSRHPESVEFTSNLIEDLKRRDFTINAMAYNPRTGLVDAFDGLGDLKRGVIKCVGVAKERFTEDALRILRAVRFSAQLGFDIESETKGAATELANTLVNISKERIQAEMEKLIMSNHPEKLRDAYEMEITKWFLPEFDTMMECEQNTIYHKYSVGEHTIKVMENVEREHYMRWAALLHDIAKPIVKRTDKNGKDHFANHGPQGKEMSKRIMRGLKMDNKTIGIVSRLVECHDYIQDIEENEIAVRRSIKKIGNDIYPMFLKLAEADGKGKSEYGMEYGRDRLLYVKEAYEIILKRGDCYCIKMLGVSGKELIESGIPSGPMLGNALDYLLDKVIEKPELNEKSKLIETALRYYKSSK